MLCPLVLLVAGCVGVTRDEALNARLKNRTQAICLGTPAVRINGESRVPMRLIFGLPAVTARAGERELSLLIDSGAEFCLVCPEIVEELPRVKPEVSKEIKELLALRSALKSKKPDFKRQEWFRYRRLGTAWRRPQGMHSKMRRHFRYRVNVVSVGYGSPMAIRSYHPSGFKERLVHNINDLKDIDPKTHAVRIAHSVGAKKRLDIIEKADEDGIRVLNRGMWFEEEEECLGLWNHQGNRCHHLSSLLPSSGSGRREHSQPRPCNYPPQTPILDGWPHREFNFETSAQLCS